MVGGDVKEVLIRGDRVWVNAKCRTYNDECAIWVERNDDSERIRAGDAIWWQGRHAMWTPAEHRDTPCLYLRCGIQYDIQIPRIGYSGASHPAKRMIDAAYEGADAKGV